MQKTQETVKKLKTLRHITYKNILQLQKHLKLAFIYMFNAPRPGALSVKHNLVLLLPIWTIPLVMVHLYSYFRVEQPLLKTQLTSHKMPLLSE